MLEKQDIKLAKKAMEPAEGKIQNLATRAVCELLTGGECRKIESEDELMNCGRVSATRVSMLSKSFELTGPFCFDSAKQSDTARKVRFINNATQSPLTVSSVAHDR